MITYRPYVYHISDDFIAPRELPYGHYRIIQNIWAHNQLILSTMVTLMKPIIFVSFACGMKEKSRSPVPVKIGSEL